MNRGLVIAILAIAFLADAAPAASPRGSMHEARPGYLQIRQIGPETYEILWRVPARSGQMRLGIYVALPDDCVDSSERMGSFAGAWFVERWKLTRPGGLSGGTIRIEGLAATSTDVLVRLERLDGTTQVVRLTASKPSFVVQDAPDTMQVAAAYLELGVEHILLGIDHLLYILAMLLVVKGWKRIVATMTAFTLTHSITLTGAALGWVRVPQPPVEACIALSILFVASEIVRSREGRPGLTERWPWVVSFTFGLLHGFGFAGALSEVGLPDHAIPVALLFFNVGVEVGQLLFILATFAVIAAVRFLARRIPMPNPTWAWRVPPYAIGGIAAFWVIQRCSLF
jgi:hydrogenase/urease accessory protein HupE